MARALRSSRSPAGLLAGHPERHDSRRSPVRSRTSTTAVLEAELRVLDRVRRERHGLTTRDKDDLVRLALQQATDARLRGDVIEARAWDAVVESEIMAAAVGL